MLVLNHKNLLSLLSSSNGKAVLAKQYLMGLKTKTEQQGTAKCYLKSTCHTLKSKIKGSGGQKEGQSILFVTGHVNELHAMAQMSQHSFH